MEQSNGHIGLQDCRHEICGYTDTVAFQSVLADARELIQQDSTRTVLAKKGYVLLALPSRIRTESGVPYELAKEGYYYPVWVYCIWKGVKVCVSSGTSVLVARADAMTELARVNGELEEQRLLVADLVLSGPPKHVLAAAKVWLNKLE